MPKARRLERHLATLLLCEAPPPRALFSLSATPALWGAPSPAHTSRASGAQADGASGDLVLEEAKPTALAHPLLEVNSDLQAVQRWIQARAGSLTTVRVYRREAHRLLLWLQYERAGSTLAQMGVPDCGAFMAFLQNIPPRWISRARPAGRRFAGPCRTKAAGRPSPSLLRSLPGCSPRSTWPPTPRRS